MKKSYVEGGKNKVSNRVLKERKPNPKVNLGFDDGSHTNINNTKQHAFNLKEDQMGGAHNVSQFLHDCGNVIANIPVNIDEDKMLDLLQIKYRWQKDWVHVINHCGIVNDDFFELNGGYMNYNSWKRYYDMGFTTLLFNILDLTKELRQINEELRPIRGSSTLANFYFSKGTNSRRPSFNVHTHDYNVIVKPIYGKVHWRINGEDFIADPAQNPNNLIIVPAYTEHQVVASTEPKLSCTFNLTA
tara:strand:+ start:1828 stop:2559 length:732 start_codon:yes stop_codon:yes gene_type:complete